MAIRQYVGARYVPRFTGLYDATQIYDALDVVDNGSGTSYIAKKTVPAGTPLTDTDFWFVYGASSGAIYDLQTRMGQAENDIIDLNTRVDRRYVFIADSYGEGTAGDPGNGWTTQVKAQLGLDNDHCHIEQLGGAGFVGNVATRFIDLLNDAALAISDPETITDVIVCGGYNDIGKANVNYAVNEFCTRANTLFPKAVVSIGMVGYTTNTGLLKSIPLTLEAYYVGITGKARIMPNLEYALRSRAALMHSDGIHPSSLGYLALSKCIASAILYGDGYDYLANSAIAVTLTDITGHDKTVYEIFNKEKISLVISPIPVDLDLITLGSTKPAANNWVKIADLGDGNILHGADYFNQMGKYCIAFGDSIVHNSDTPNPGYTHVPCVIGIHENELYYAPIGIDPSTHSYYSFTNADTIALPGVWEFLTMYN